MMMYEQNKAKKMKKIIFPVMPSAKVKALGIAGSLPSVMTLTLGIAGVFAECHDFDTWQRARLC